MGWFFLLVIRPTKTLTREIDPKVESIETSTVNDFLSWHANNFLLNRKKHIIFMNDKSRLSITISGIRSNQYKDIRGIFLTNLKDYLLAEGLNESLIDRYIGIPSYIHFANTNNRSVLGTITESIKLMDYLYDRETIPGIIELNMENNRIIYKPINYNKPIDVFKEEIKKHFI